MFGFKHTMNGIDHNSLDHKLIRTRLYARLLQVNGPIYLQNLFPLLKEKVNATLDVELKKGKKLSGMATHSTNKCEFGHLNLIKRLYFSSCSSNSSSTGVEDNGCGFLR